MSPNIRSRSLFRWSLFVGSALLVGAVLGLLATNL